MKPRATPGRTRGLALWILGALVLGCAAASTPKPGTPEADFAAAKREFDERHFFDAVLRLGEFIEHHPGSVLVDQAVYLRGRAHQEQKDWSLAAADFERLVQDFPESRFACDAEYALGECYWRQSRKWPYDQTDTRRTVDQFRRYLSRCPDHPRRAEAEAMIAKARSRLAEKEFHNGELYIRMHQYEAALVYCDVVISDYADTPWVCDARRLRADVLSTLNRQDEAKSEIDWVREHCGKAAGAVPDSAGERTQTSSGG